MTDPWRVGADGASTPAFDRRELALALRAVRALDGPASGSPHTASMALHGLAFGPRPEFAWRAVTAPSQRQMFAQAMAPGRARSVAAFFALLLGSLHAVASTRFPSYPAGAAASAGFGLGVEGTSMEFRKIVAVVSSALVVSAASQAQNAMQWRVEDGGNGHWYRAVREQGPICWDAASQLASINGGHLATITTPQEQAWIGWLASATVVAPLDESGPWIGATCSGAPWGQWSWVTGEPFDYQGWLPSAPNPGWNEEFVHLWRWSDSDWNDGYRCGTNGPLTVHGLVIEWSADCNADGIVDFGQIRAGDLEDVNANNIPDCCEQQTPCDPCSADIDQSGTVNGVDLAALLSVWGTDGAKYARADIDGNGNVDAADLAAVLNAWGPCP